MIPLKLRKDNGVHSITMTVTPVDHQRAQIGAILAETRQVDVRRHHAMRLRPDMDVVIRTLIKTTEDLHSSEGTTPGRDPGQCRDHDRQRARQSGRVAGESLQRTTTTGIGAIMFEEKRDIRRSILLGDKHRRRASGVLVPSVRD